MAAVPNIDELLTFTKENGASDLHLSSGSAPVIRIHGLLRKINLPELSRTEMDELILSAVNEDRLRKFNKNKAVDFSKELEDVARFRINIFQQIHGVAGVFRVIPSEIPSFEELGLPESMKKMSLAERGIVLLTGPTGCGKSTSLAAMLDHHNQNRYHHIITIEDPVEFVHSSKNCLINQRELGLSTHTFSDALRVAMREDPDVILVGEMRDLETVSMAIAAAETGHLVFATLHTSGAARTISRLIDMFPQEQQPQVRSMLSESLEAVVTQSLIPKKDGKGRAVALEVMIANHAIRNLVREEKIYQIPSIIQSSANLGMQNYDTSLYNLVSTGKIDKSEAIRRAEDPRIFEGGMI